MFALTDVGQSREHNEDTFLVASLESDAVVTFDDGFHEITADAHGLLFLVADGMGGAASGELASSMAGHLVFEALRASWATATTPNAATFAEALRDATVHANTRIHQHAREHPEHRGMGTTATIAGLLGDQLFLVQVGDSRAYLVRNGLTTQLTKDQSLMQRLVEAGELTPEEAEVSDRRNIILQALGPDAQVTVDLTHQQLRRGDTLILCSDGLSGLLRGDEIGALTTAEPDVRLVCRQLIDRANARGGPDNITVIAVRFEGDALVASRATDRVEYTAYPLEGTLYDQTREKPVSRPARPPFRSDPTPQTRGVRMPTHAEPREIDDRDASTPLSDPRHAARQRAVQPLFVLLGAVALAALAWTVRRLLAP